MGVDLDPNARVNLSKAVVLVVETTSHAADILGQILKGFGVSESHRTESVRDASDLLKHKAFDLILIDPDVEGGAGYEMLRNLRASMIEPNCFAPVILMSGHPRVSHVKRARDTGANYFVSKPVAPSILLQRILWVARDKRPFVEAGGYVGPDRRFKFEGLPADSDGRRATDLNAPLGDCGDPNMSQGEIDGLLKPQKVSLSASCVASVPRTGSRDSLSSRVASASAKRSPMRRTRLRAFAKRACGRSTKSLRCWRTWPHDPRPLGATRPCTCLPTRYSARAAASA